MLHILFVEMSARNINSEPGGDRLHKLKVAQIEAENLKTKIEDLESNLALNRQLVNDMLLTGRSEESLSDRTDVAPFVSYKIMEALLAEKSLLQDRLKFVDLDKKDAMNKANYAEKIIRDLCTKESKLYQDTESRIQKLLSESEAKEKIIQDLEAQMRIYETEIDLFNQKIEKQPTKAELIKLFNQKLHHIQNITSKLRANLTRVEYQRMRLKNKCKEMYSQLNKITLQIMDAKPKPQMQPYILDEPEDVYFDDFYKSEENILDASFVEKFDSNTDPCREISNQGKNYSFNNEDYSGVKHSVPNEDKLVKKIDRLKKKLEENHIKLETLTLESVGAARLNESLKDDQEILRHALEKSLQEEKRLEGAILKFGQQPKLREASRKLSSKTTIKKGKSHSNPLDYLCEKSTLVPIKSLHEDTAPLDAGSSYHSEASLDLTQKNTPSIEDDKEMPSIILQREEDMAGDSLIIDMFDLKAQ